jgi:hypothetical protein
MNETVKDQVSHMYVQVASVHRDSGHKAHAQQGKEVIKPSLRAADPTRQDE